MKNLFLLSAFLLSLFMANLSAQTSLDTVENPPDAIFKKDVLEEVDQTLDQRTNKTFLKLNLTGIPFRNYSFQVERTLTKLISLSLAYRIMPEGDIPFKSQITNSVGNDDPDIINSIENLQISDYAITPEIRFYISKKGYGNGFYFSAFYRHAQYDLTDFPIDFEDGDGAQNTIKLSGKVKGNTAGILVGAQWAVGKHLCIDWWILGAHYGSAQGVIDGVSSMQLSAIEQDDLEEQLNDIDIPLSEIDVVVTANGASLKIDGPWAGIRAGLSFGIKF